MNHSIIPGPVPAAAGQHWVERPLYRAHRLRPEAHPRPQAGFNRQNQAEYPSDFRPPNAHRDGRVTNEYVCCNQSTARIRLTSSSFSQFSGRPRQTASRGASHYAAERRDVRQTERHGKFTKAVSSEGSQPTDVQEKRTAHEDSDIKQARPVQTTERPLQGFGLEYAGRDDFDCHQIKGPELGCLEQKKDSDDRVANLSVNEETADALWIEIEDLLHEMSPESSNHLPREHGPEIEEVNVHTVLQGPFMTKEDMPPRIRDILAKASKLSQQPRHLAGPSISAHSLELLHPDIICAIRALRDEEP